MFSLFLSVEQTIHDAILGVHVHTLLTKEEQTKSSNVAYAKQENSCPCDTFIWHHLLRLELILPSPV